MLVNVPDPKRIHLSPSDRSVGSLEGILGYSLVALGDRGRRRRRPLLNGCHKGIEQRLGVAREHHSRLTPWVSSRTALHRRSSADAIDLRERSAISLEGLGLRPVVR